MDKITHKGTTKMKKLNKLMVIGASGCFALSLTAVAVANTLPEQELILPIDLPIIEDTPVNYIVKFRNDNAAVSSTDGRSAGTFSEQQAASILNRQQLTAITYLDSVQAAVVKLTPEQHAALLADPAVEYIEEDHKRYLLDVITPMAQTVPYGITMVQANQVSDAYASNTKVCIIDSGYTPGHEDLPGSGVTGYAFSGTGVWNNDGNSHGTHVAGTILALDNTGVIGVLPSGQVGLHIVKVFNDAGNWTTASNLIQAIQSCQNAGAKVVNMSLGGSGSNQTENTAMTNFYNNGMLLVAAAGNAGTTAFSYPASYSSVVSVAAVDSSRNHASFSQRNSQVDIAAPGVAVQSTLSNGGYGSYNGTSMASPHVAGVSALVWSHHPSCTAPQIRSALTATAQDRGAAGRDNLYGWGIVQAKAAHDYLTANGCSGSGGGNPPTGGDSFPNLSGTAGQWLRGSYTIPAGVSQVTFSISGGSGDADLYVQYGSQPTTTSYQCRPYLTGNNEVCTFNNPQAGTWHVGIRGYTAFSGVTFSYQY
jgi:serine protease